MLALAFLLAAQDENWLDELIERDTKFASAVIERVVNRSGERPTTIEYVQVDGFANSETKTTEGSEKEPTDWFAYKYQFSVKTFDIVRQKLVSIDESFDPHSPKDSSQKHDNTFVLIVGGMGITGGGIDRPYRNPMQARWEALSSIGLGVSLMQDTAVMQGGRSITVRGTVPNIGTIEYVFEIGKILKPRRLTNITKLPNNADRFFVDHEMVDGIILASMSVRGDETTFLKSASTTVPESKTFPIDWLNENTVLHMFLGCNGTRTSYSTLVKSIGHKPTSILEIIASRFPHLAER